MFVYSNNNHINYIDPNGSTALSPTKELNRLNDISGGGFGGGGSGILIFGTNTSLWSTLYTTFIAPVVSVFANILSPSISIEENDDVKELTDDIIQNPTPVYYGAKIYNHQFQKITPPMTITEAVAWCYNVSSLKIDEGGMGVNTKWGVYTIEEKDALAIYPLLLPTETNFPVPAPIFHIDLSGIYPHIHLPDFLFNSKHKHFHIWYGIIGGS